MPSINTAPGCTTTAAEPLDLNGRAEAAAGGAGAGTTTPGFDQELVFLQDDNLGVITQFMRVRTLDEDTQVVGHVDRLLDGTTAYTPTGTVSLAAGGGTFDIAPDATDLKDTEMLVKEYTGVATVDRAAVLADLGSAALVELDILVRQVANINDTVAVTMGGNTINLPVGGSTTLRAQPGRRLADFSISLDTDEAVNITAQGVN